MQHLQDVFNEIQAAKNEMKSITELYRNALTNNGEYQAIKEQMEELKQKKKQIEDAIQAELGSQYEKLEELKRDIKNNKEMMSDIAISTLMEGKTVEVRDELNILYEPKFAVTFKKTEVKAEEPAAVPAEENEAVELAAEPEAA